MRQREYIKISGKREIWGVRVAPFEDGMAKLYGYTKLSTS